MKKHETFDSHEEALACQSQHKGAEITVREGHPIMLGGRLTYVVPEDCPSWTVWWEEPALPDQ